MGHTLLDKPWNIKEADLFSQKASDCDFVGGIEDGRSRAAGT